MELGFDHECDADVEQPPLSALMLRRHALDALGGFDERFFMYWEDVEFALRMDGLAWAFSLLGYLGLSLSLVTISGLPMSPAWMMCSTPASASSASGRSRP